MLSCVCLLYVHYVCMHNWCKNDVNSINLVYVQFVYMLDVYYMLYALYVCIVFNAVCYSMCMYFLSKCHVQIILRVHILYSQLHHLVCTCNLYISGIACAVNHLVCTYIYTHTCIFIYISCFVTCTVVTNVLTYLVSLLICVQFCVLFLHSKLQTYSSMIVDIFLLHDIGRIPACKAHTPRVNCQAPYLWNHGSRQDM